MSKFILGTGYFGWNAIERRSNRYGAFFLSSKSETTEYVLLDPDLDKFEGVKGKLIAEVLEPVKSFHIGDLARQIFPSLPEMGEKVVLGEGELFIEHYGLIHEKSELERNDEKQMEFMRESLQIVMDSIIKAIPNSTVKEIYNSNHEYEKDFPDKSNEKEKVYDLIGLRPEDGRENDWLDPKSFYRIHCSKVNIWFETLE